MKLDFLTLMAVMATNLFAIAAALPLVMGRSVSQAARNVQASMLLQGVAWAAIIASSSVWDQALSTLSMACNAWAQWLLYRALREWLGARPFKRTLLALVCLMPLGYALGFGHYAFRVGWANFLMAAILVIVARATMYPATPSTPADTRWRRTLMLCLLTSAGFTLARGVLGAFTDQYPSFRTPHPVNLAAALATNVSLVLGTVAVLVAWHAEAERKLHRLAMTDGLTGLANRRSFADQGAAMISHAQRHGLPLTALMLDIDYFKQINDTMGHETGDRALQLFGRLLQECHRSGDMVGRLGGEEFGVLLLHNSAPAGTSFDRRLRMRLAEASLSELGFTLDYSAGMAVLGPQDHDLAPLMARADAALYAAKTSGRGRLVAAPAPEV
ncbi:GGDEF domain-containing protein [Acidovorax sp. DW039]|uniref:GGDEF domain-containing protein n=1 Tax=Acidovorax sp. DW039 TaxID=3095606 RepID=UPI003085DD00|nr:GGDEF domain-containing protein [Acidovorax sp. DW039]